MSTFDEQNWAVSVSAISAGVNLLSGGAEAVDWWKTAAPQLDWINIWTAWDPVPSGPISDHEEARAAEALSVAAVTHLFTPDDGGRKNSPSDAPATNLETSTADESRPNGPEEWPVYNLASVIRDHVTYTDNIPQVIRPIAARLISLTTKQPVHLPAVDEGHIRRVRKLGTVRILCAASAIGLLPMSWGLVAEGSVPRFATAILSQLSAVTKSVAETPVIGSILVGLLQAVVTVIDSALVSVAMFVIPYLT